MMRTIFALLPLTMQKELNDSAAGYQPGIDVNIFFGDEVQLFYHISWHM